MDWVGTQHRTDRIDIFADLNGRLPFDDEFADTVVAFQVLEHLREPRRFLAEAFRILRPGGSLYLTTPFMWRVHEEPHDYYRYTRFGLQHLVDQAGFEQVVVTANTGFWLTWVLKLTYHVSARTPRLLRPVWWPWWYAGQRLAPMLDAIDPDESETASYTVTATRSRPSRTPRHSSSAAGSVAVATGNVVTGGLAMATMGVAWGSRSANRSTRYPGAVLTPLPTEGSTAGHYFIEPAVSAWCGPRSSGYAPGCSRSSRR